ncbi:MAG: DoxX family membrane protein [Acidobacteria bacterium]|nr:DoxX family membrane protein [Acidobacteriota bacterium]
MNRVRSILTWLLQILLGAVFVLAGTNKFQMWDGWADRFDPWGLAAWFLAIVAVSEALGGLLILVPRTAVFGAGLTTVIMLGAAFTHIRTGDGSPWGVIILAGLSMTVVALRWRDRWRSTSPSGARSDGDRADG